MKLYTLRNAKGVTVTLMDYGATVVDLKVPDRAGHVADVSLGFDDFNGYLHAKNPYFGTIVGRYGNRIAKGKFTLEGKEYTLATNNNGNHLHGGTRGFDKQVWTGEVLAEKNAVRFTRTSPDGEEGFPGALEVEVIYTLSDNSALQIDYTARTDRPTVVNLTNHLYFNLAGDGTSDIRKHELKIAASRYTPVDATLIPTGELAPVDDTPFDFRKATTIGARLAKTGGEPAGYDHNFVLDKGSTKKPEFAAEAYDPSTGRVLTVLTMEPGVQFYSGNFLDGTMAGKGGVKYPQYSGFCLETQHFPDSPNQPKFPSTVLRPGETYRTTTIYAFSTR